MRVKTNCSIDEGPDKSSAWYITKAIKELGHEIVTGYEADLVLNIDGMPHVDRLPGAKYFFWDCDSFMHEPLKEKFDMLFIGGSPEDLDRYPKGTIYLPHAFDPEFHKPHDVKKEFDLVMIGRKDNVYSKRNDLVEKLKEHFTVYYEQAPFGHEYARAMSRGKLILNTTLGEKNIPIRFFEGMAIGCLLENYNDNLDSIAIEGIHYIGYTNKNIIDKIKYYLSHEDERDKIATNARKHALKYHTYQHRAKEILKCV